MGDGREGRLGFEEEANGGLVVEVGELNGADREEGEDEGFGGEGGAAGGEETLRAGCRCGVLERGDGKELRGKGKG